MPKSISQNKSSKLIMTKYLRRAIAAYMSGDNAGGYRLYFIAYQYAPLAYISRLSNLLFSLPVE